MISHTNCNENAHNSLLPSIQLLPNKLIIRKLIIMALVLEKIDINYALELYKICLKTVPARPFTFTDNPVGFDNWIGLRNYYSAVYY